MTTHPPGYPYPARVEDRPDLSAFWAESYDARGSRERAREITEHADMVRFAAERDTSAARVAADDTRPDVPHYRHAAVEHIDILRAVLPPEQFRGFCRGNVLKYLYRLDHKGAALADAKKAQDYLRWFVESLEAE